MLFAREGANVAIVYLEEDTDAEDTKRLVEQEGRSCLLIKGDVGSSAFCQDAIKRALGEFGKLDVLVNNAAEQHTDDDLDDINEALDEDTDEAATREPGTPEQPAAGATIEEVWANNPGGAKTYDGPDEDESYSDPETIDREPDQ